MAVFFFLNFLVPLDIVKKTNKPKVVLTLKVEGRSGRVELERAGLDG